MPIKNLIEISWLKKNKRENVLEIWLKREEVRDKYWLRDNYVCLWVLADKFTMVFEVAVERLQYHQIMAKMVRMKLK